MLFNSFSYLVFFPTIASLFFILPHKLRWLFLLGASSIFYMAFVPKYILVLLTLILTDYFAAILISKHKRKTRKIFLILSLTANIGFLAFFKYYNFLNVNLEAVASFFRLSFTPQFLNILLPLGLSFHTFQSMAYTIEVYKHKQKPEKHLGIYALYVMFFPQLVAGPIERPQHLLPQLHKKHKLLYSNLSIGLKLMAWGYFKKLVIADRAAFFVNPVFNNPQQFTGFSYILAAIFFAFQIYCDFSGYTDIARGSARVMGFDLVPNFARPYFSISPQDFWRRWHMSLSSWFRDYLYIPLGGNRVKFARWCFNILIVFVLCGLWHGANWTYAIWGLLHGLFIIGQIIITKGLKFRLKSSLLKIIMTFSLVSFAWIFFRASTVQEGLYMTANLFNNTGFNLLSTNSLLQYVVIGQQAHDFFVLIIAIIFLLVTERYLLASSNIKRLFQNPAIRWAAYYALIFTILVFGIFSQSRFIYFQF